MGSPGGRYFPRGLGGSRGAQSQTPMAAKRPIAEAAAAAADPACGSPPTYEESVAKLPKLGEIPDDLHVYAWHITEELLDSWVVEAPKAAQEMYVSGIGKFKDKYKIVFTAGGILPADGLRFGDYGESLDVSITDPNERAGMEIFNAWCRKKFLRPDCYKERGLTPELMLKNFEPLMSADGTIKVRCDRKNPPLMVKPNKAGKLSEDEQKQLGGKPWDRMVLEIKSFYNKSLKGAISSRLVFLRANPAVVAVPQEPKVSVNYDT